MSMDYVNSSGKIVKCGQVWPDVMVRTSSDLTLLNNYNPGTIAFTAGHLQEWQRAADGTWVEMASPDPEHAAQQAAASAMRAADDAAAANASAAAAQANTAGLQGWSLTKESDDTVSIDYTET